MRINIYAEEITQRVEIVSKEADGQTFTGVRFYLELPVTVLPSGPSDAPVQQISGPFIHRPGDDDSSAVTFWGKRDLREVLKKALALLDRDSLSGITMPRPEYFRAVVVRAIERNYKLDSRALADKIIEALDLAEDILGDSPSPQPNVLIKTLPVSNNKPLDLSGAILIGEEAPPAAVIRNPDGVIQGDTEEEIESKKAQLSVWIANNLPRSMTLKLPGFEKDIQLNQYIRVSPAKMNFIRVFYTQFPEEEDGPQLQLSTSDTNLNAEAIKADIVQQAQSRYRAQKQKLEARIPPPNPMPDLDQMMRSAKYDPASETVSQEDREQWNSTAGRKVI